jgi:hypothetical protein
MLEALGKTNTLPQELRPLLSCIDGHKTLQTLCREMAMSRVGRDEYFLAGFKRLIQLGYIRTVVMPMSLTGTSTAPSPAGEDLDFTAR